MRRFVEEADRGQWTLLPECVDNFIAVANKMARIAWAIMAKGGHYRAPELAAAA